MNTQADWWLLLLGLGIGAGLTWLVLAEIRRHDDDVAAEERVVEATWIADTLTASGTEADTEGIEEVLRLHRLYLASLPFDEPAWVAGTPTWLPATETATASGAGVAASPRPHVPAEAGPATTGPAGSDGDATPVEGDGAERKPAE